MFKSIADIFNNPKAIYNDPLYEIHNQVQKCESAPEFEEYEEFLDNLDSSAYPKPKIGIIHNTVNPLHNKLKPVIIK